MRPLTLLALLSVPLLTLAQSSNSSNNVQVSTLLSTSVGINGNHQQTTQVITSLITVTSSAAASQASNSTSSGSSTSSSNSTSNSTSSSSQVNLPTATFSVDGGGNGPGGAPSPGASSNSGIYGPDDGYISSAVNLGAVTVVSVLAGVIGGVCLVWT